MVALFKNLEPVRVSPLIRGARWALLAMGISYGISKQKLYESLEASKHADLEKKEEMKEAVIKKERECVLGAPKVIPPVEEPIEEQPPPVEEPVQEEPEIIEIIEPEVKQEKECKLGPRRGSSPKSEANE